MVRTIVIAGALAQRHGYGGHAWVFLQYLLGFRRLGLEVLFVDRLEPETSLGSDGRPCPPNRSAGWRYLDATMRRFGLEDSVALLHDGGRVCLGMDRAELVRRVRHSSLLVNVMGYLDDDELLGAAVRRVFLDIDPGFVQMWRELGLHDPFAGHDAFVTIAENIGSDGCGVPTCGLDWVTTRPPVVLDEWPAARGGTAFTSVCSWRGPNGPVEYRGRTYGLRAHEFRALAPLPVRSGRRFELALDIDPSETKDLALLRENGWELRDPASVARDADSYRAFVGRSAAELMVAKGMYVRTRSGWFSDRSACYLASGKPVVAQDTGLGGLLPLGEGLLAFSSLDEAAEAVDDVCARYDAHARAAREIAEGSFDSDVVLGRLLDRLGAP